MSLEGGLKLAWGEAGPLRNYSILINICHISFSACNISFFAATLWRGVFYFLLSRYVPQKGSCASRSHPGHHAAPEASL